MAPCDVTEAEFVYFLLTSRRKSESILIGTILFVRHLVDIKLDAQEKLCKLLTFSSFLGLYRVNILSPMHLDKKNKQDLDLNYQFI